MTTTAYDPSRIYLHLDRGRAEPMAVDETFWPGVMRGSRLLPGWLVAMYEWAPAEEAPGGGHSEVHPLGDEVHVCLAGAMTAVLEHDGGDERVDFGAGEACVIPIGVWHHLMARAPSRVLSMTFGEGSQHR
jgi:mannose-6-phosphate isomerase-like protein (cupin superfamily)